MEPDKSEEKAVPLIQKEETKQGDVKPDDSTKCIILVLLSQLINTIALAMSKEAMTLGFTIADFMTIRAFVALAFVIPLLIFYKRDPIWGVSK